MVRLTTNPTRIQVLRKKIKYNDVLVETNLQHIILHGLRLVGPMSETTEKSRVLLNCILL